ncbi:winged helix DNA-binding protein [Chelatococcus asaccharovorans]|uniref:winged helix DNA-binding protein n=1 Tax=Chelatococcus asaccharovorans TaxID=28210 RepID=UPI00224C74C2|nr:winged helix DNA-binding protein [Chelatococcus asaccharovorans]CAH1670974.1 putative MarR family transcription regulator [Chelatococcus asaccharovorans]CAH1677604.1 putative MarR family transcription regulator [Chelatococcus asaccharovorans]
MQDRPPQDQPPHDVYAAPSFQAGPIVSSAHLAANSQLPQLSEFEFGLILAGHAFDRWMSRCMAAAGLPGLSPLEVLVLHSVTHRQRPKRLADICLVLGIEDSHTVVYALKKLESQGMIYRIRQGKEKLVLITEAGEKVCQRYGEIRERLLVSAVSALGMDPKAISAVASTMRALSGHYEQAARTAATF